MPATRLHILWLACATAGFTITAAVGCALALAASALGAFPPA